MPHIVGIVDGTHVAIVKPPHIGTGGRMYRQEDFINRKGYHSINTQIVSRADILINT